MIGRRVVLGGLAGSAVMGEAARAQTVTAWRPPCGADAGIASIALEGTGAPEGTVVTFGLAFAPRQVSGEQGLSARIDGHGALRTQLDVVTRHPDGSARFGLVALAAPALRAGERAVVVFHAAPRLAASLDSSAALQGRQAVLELGPATGRPWQVDLLEQARPGLLDGGGLWQAGPLVVQHRVTLLVPREATGGVTSLRLVADIAVQADGVLVVDAWLRNDIAMRQGGGQARYGMRLRLDGRDALAAEGLVHHQYTAWGRRVAARPGGQPAAAPPHVRHDTARLADLGTIARYDLSAGVAPGLLEAFATQIASAAWQVPLGPRGIAQNMYVAGGRDDIGPTTMSQAAWLITGDPRAAAYAIGQAEAAGSVPWHFWDADGLMTSAGGWLDTRAWPLLWTDRRGGAPPRGLREPVATDTGWAPDCAHQPDLSYVPWLLTGRRAFLDGLQAQAAWCVMSQSVDQRGAPRRRGPGETVNVVRGNQVRGAAWSLRQLGNAVWAAPASDRQRGWVQPAEEGNWAWVRAQLPAWTAAQGETHGWIPAENTGAGDLKPWMQDMFVSAAAAAARRGQADARAVLAWMENFIAGRFLAAGRGFNPRDGCAYVLANAPARGWAAPYDSWAAMGAETVARGWSNRDGWGQSAGNYGQYALQSLAALIDVLDSDRAKRAYAWLKAAAPPFTRASDFQAEPVLNIVPRGQPRLSASPRGCARAPR